MAYSWSGGGAILIGNGDLSGSFTLRLPQGDGIFMDVEVPGELLANFVHELAAWAIAHTYRVDMMPRNV